MNRRIFLVAALLFLLAITGLNPFSPYQDSSGLLNQNYNDWETGIHRQANGILVVKALTRMPKVQAPMVKWWFSDYMQTTEHYKKWHPSAHVWMDWENKTPGEIIGASHLVHEYIGKDLQKLRIQFIDPSEFLGSFPSRNDQFIVCAKVGLLDEPINMTSMCHFVRDTAWGAEMRSIFWLGHIAKREGNQQVSSIQGFIGNTALMRFLLADKTLANDLMTHAIEEMGFLADFLPSLYKEENERLR